jgi:hypothetical protein
LFNYVGVVGTDKMSQEKLTTDMRLNCKKIGLKSYGLFHCKAPLA